MNVHQSLAAHIQIDSGYRLPRASAFLDPQLTTADDVATDLIDRYASEGRAAALAHLDAMPVVERAKELNAVMSPEDADAVLLLVMEADAGKDVRGPCFELISRARQAYADRNQDEHAARIAIREGLL